MNVGNTKHNLTFDFVFMNVQAFDYNLALNNVNSLRIIRTRFFQKIQLSPNN